MDPMVAVLASLVIWTVVLGSSIAIGGRMLVPWGGPRVARGRYAICGAATGYLFGVSELDAASPLLWTLVTLVAIAAVKRPRRVDLA